MPQPWIVTVTHNGDTRRYIIVADEWPILNAESFREGTEVKVEPMLIVTSCSGHTMHVIKELT